MIVYKLTDQYDMTYVLCEWGPGVTHEADGRGKLCTEHWIHAYEHPLLAVLHDPMHAAFGKIAHLWRAEASGKIKRDGQMKLGTTRLTTIERMELPTVTIDQRIRYARACDAQADIRNSWRHYARSVREARTKVVAALARREMAYVAALTACHATAWAIDKPTPVDLIGAAEWAVGSEEALPWHRQ